MAHTNIARKAYSAEQLLALRHSASDETAIQIGARAQDGAIKDHVVRNARSFAARSSRSLAISDTLHPPPHPTEPRQSSAPVLTEIDPNNQNLRPGLASNRYRPSPTPSLKKRKAEQILEDHGSPPGLRVTAGGRIVPSDQSPLCSPRYGYSAIKKNGMLIKFGPNFPAPPGGIPMQRVGLPNGFVAQDPDGRLCQMVDGKFLPVDDIDGIPQLYIAAPNLTGSTGFPAGEKQDASGATPFDNAIRQQQPNQSFDKAPPTGPAAKQTTVKQPVINVNVQIQALEKQYAKLEQESKDLDKVEVLQRSSMGAKAYAQLVQTRRDLVSRMNSIRVSLKSLREAKSSTDHSPQPVAQPLQPQFSMPPYGPAAIMGPAGPMHDWTFDGIGSDTHNMPPFQSAPMPHGLGYYGPPPGYPGSMAPYPGMFGPIPPMFNMMGMPPVDAFGNFIPNAAHMDPQAFSSGSPSAPHANAVHETGPSNRRPAETAATSQPESPRKSHALQIKDPENKSESSQKSALNPMSPSYQPAGKSTPASKIMPARPVSPSPALAEAVRQHNAWVTESANVSTSNLNSGGSQRKLRYESSSSSYATADFFPNNPRDHSMRKDAYPVVHDGNASRSKMAERASTSSEHPITPDKENQLTGWNFAPVASVTMPPTMCDQPTDQSCTPELHSKDPVQNRSQMNVSPKNRRSDYPLSYKSVSEVTTLGSELPSPAIGSSSHTQLQQAKPALSSKEHLSLEEATYLAGFKAGQARLPVGLEKNSFWLDGYCAGLLQSAQPTTAPSQPKAPKPAHAAPVIIKPYLPAEQKKVVSQRAASAAHINATSMNTLKDAIFSAQNENAILTPDPNGPCVNEMAALHLGSWAKTHQAPTAADSDAVLASVRNRETVLPVRTSSVMQCQMSGADTSTEHNRTGMPSIQTTGVMMDRQRVHVPQDRRATSAQVQTTGGSPTAHYQRNYPAHRVMSSQLEWKSGSSIAQVAGLATGYFAQYDGTRTGANTLADRRPLTPLSGNTGMTTHDTMSGALPEKQPGMSARFTEESMTVDNKTGSPSSSPGKRSAPKGSPAKVKFAQIAGRAGIKVRSDSRDEQESEPSSPQEKRRWRDVWTKRFTETGGREGEQKQGGRP